MSTSLQSGKLKGKRITFQQTQTPIGPDLNYDIIVFDYNLSNNVRSSCNLGLIKDLDQLVAIKRVENKKALTNIASFEEFRNKYKNELENIYEAGKKSRMTVHSNIVKVFPLACYSANKTHAYIIMEFCKGGTLDAELNVRRMVGKWFTFHELKSIIKQLINGYDQLYRSQILHQNINATNIFINQGYVKIGGFGLSCKLNNPLSVKIHGSPYETAPEKYKSDYSPSPASDIFSLGVLFYSLIFDKHPYYESQMNQNFYKGNFSLKEAVQRKQKQSEIMLMEIQQRQIKDSHKSFIICENSQQVQNLKKIVIIVKKMLQKKPQNRIKFEQLLLVFTQLLVGEVEPIQFLNVKPIPAKLNYIIESESKVEKKSLKFEPMELTDIKKIHPLLYNIRYEAERINLVSDLLFSITRRLEIEIEVSKIRDICITATKQKLLEFNFCLTYNKYSQIINQVAGLENEIKKSYYRTGIDCIVNNTRVNHEFLLNQIVSSGEVCRLEEILQLAEMSSEAIFKDMWSFLEITLVKTQNKMIDPTNYNCYMVISFVLFLVGKIGWNFTIEQIEQLTRQFRIMESKLGTFQLWEIVDKLKNFGITFSIMQERD